MSCADPWPTAARIWLDLLLGQGVDRVLVNTRHLAEQVTDYVARCKWRERIDLVHEVELLGTGGTILQNRLLFADQPFIVAHGDNLTRFDLSAFIARHRDRPPGVQIK
jgi:mannose-1-phosphate guanylyltransferase